MQFPTGGDVLIEPARDSLFDQALDIQRLTWCDSKADGTVRMREDQHIDMPFREVLFPYGMSMIEPPFIWCIPKRGLLSILPTEDSVF